MSKIVPLNVNLNPDTADTLKKLSNNRGLSLTEVIRRAISVYSFIEDERQRGNTVQVVSQDGVIRKLVLM